MAWQWHGPTLASNTVSRVPALQLPLALFHHLPPLALSSKMATTFTLPPILHAALTKGAAYFRPCPFAAFFPRAVEEVLPTKTTPIPTPVVPTPTTPIAIASTASFSPLITSIVVLIILLSAFGLGLFIVVRPPLFRSQSTS